MSLTQKELAAQHGVTAKKKFGQNFLIDNNMIEKIVRGAGITSDDTVLEIGPGMGALTQVLSKTCKKVICIEIDTTMIPILQGLNLPNVEVIQGDILKIDLDQILAQQGKEGSVKVVANLPYYISTPIITRLLEASVSSITIMIQKEVADRLNAQPSTKAYGSLTVFANYHANISLVTNVPATCFWPKPNVDSSVLHFDLSPQKNAPRQEEPKDVQLFYSLVRNAFANRRKTLVNSVNIANSSIPKDTIAKALTTIGLNDNARAEQLSLAQYISLSNAMHDIST